MIKANELRVGNWVICDSALYGSPQIQVIGVTIQQIYSLPNHQGENLQGIPLTPETLEKCGFEKVANGVALTCKNENNETVIASLFSGHPLTIEVYGMRSPLWHIKHLHQLQNLYFALTGEELAVNL